MHYMRSITTITCQKHLINQIKATKKDYYAIANPQIHYMPASYSFRHLLFRRRTNNRTPPRKVVVGHKKLLEALGSSFSSCKQQRRMKEKKILFLGFRV